MKAVLFDLFETLITEWGRPKYTTCQMASDLGVDARDFRREWEALHGDRYLGKLSGTKMVLEVILHRLGVSGDQEMLDLISEKRDACKRACFDEIEMPVLDMLASLKGQGYKLGLISNCSSEEITGLYDCALTNYFDAMVLSCNVGMVKPNADIYDHCLSLVNEQPYDCFFVGDGGSDELAGAKQTGMTPLRAVWFIKRFVDRYDLDKRFPLFYEPAEAAGYMKPFSG